MAEPFDPSPEPMLAKPVAQVPDDHTLSFEPKWDGFRALIAVSPDGGVEIGSRGSKPLTRYFPELVAEAGRQLPRGTVVDGEIIVRRPTEGGERL
ncbi:MAG: ATP-dependent DNA ligase, partial [Pseudolysinimonas sp.]